MAARRTRSSSITSIAQISPSSGTMISAIASSVSSSEPPPSATRAMSSSIRKRRLTCRTFIAERVATTATATRANATMTSAKRRISRRRDHLSAAVLVVRLEAAPPLRTRRTSDGERMRSAAGEAVGARHVALGLAAGAAWWIASATFSGLGDDPAGERFFAQLGRREALGADEAGQDHADVDAVRLLLGVEGVGPADQGELAGRVGAGAGAGDAAGGAGDVDDRARRRCAEQRQQRLGEPDDRVEVELHVAVDVGVAALGEAAAPGGAGVVDEQVQGAAVLGLEVGADPLRGVLVGQIDGDVGRADRAATRPAPAAAPRGGRRGRARSPARARAGSPSLSRSPWTLPLQVRLPRHATVLGGLEDGGHAESRITA